MISAQLRRATFHRSTSIWVFVVLVLSSPHRCAAQTLGPEFRRDYSLTDLGRVTGLPARQGGLIIQRGSGEYDTLLIGGSANTSQGKLYRVKVTRDQQDNIVGFGKAEFYAEAPFNDGGLCYAANGILLCSQWPVNNLGQLKPGSRAPDRVVNLGPENSKDSLASLNFYMPSGHLKMLSWSSGRWWDAMLRQSQDGTYDVIGAKHVTTLGGGPEGFVYVPGGSPRFDRPSMLVAEWSAGNIAAYDINPSGDPIPRSRRVFVAGLKGAEGGVIDPLTGDYLFTTFGGGDRVIRVDGLKVPDNLYYSDQAYPPQRVLKIGPSPGEASESTSPAAQSADDHSAEESPAVTTMDRPRSTTENSLAATQWHDDRGIPERLEPTSQNDCFASPIRPPSANQGRSTRGRRPSRGCPPVSIDSCRNCLEIAASKPHSSLGYAVD